MPKLLSKTLLCYLILFSVMPVFAQSNKAAAIDSFMRRANRLGLFNGNVLVADDGKMVYKAAIGFTDTSMQTMLTEKYRFQIGSIA
ncbi:hypothetical protein [Mucilaginibacter lacusdianchii]|uniref:hypothetical protein n=1 Tax=Mucilaginibacter lacusdianchii TaxID=2684211 RepID=UPI0018EEE9BA|nr:hypothetical protein [Mucilaginibacter sp. JXJ CY 39]